MASGMMPVQTSLRQYRCCRAWAGVYSTQNRGIVWDRHVVIETSALVWEDCCSCLGPLLQDSVAKGRL